MNIKTIVSLPSLRAIILCYVVFRCFDLSTATPVFEHVGQEVLQKFKFGQGDIDDKKFTKTMENRTIRDVSALTKPPHSDELINSMNCAKDHNIRDRYSSSFSENSTDPNMSLDEDLSGIFEEHPGPRKVQTVHMGEDVTLCWIETTIIHEDGSFDSPKRSVVREYTISFENSAEIPPEYIDCRKYRGELDPDDLGVGETALFEVIDENTRVSRVVNFTSVSHVGSIVVWQYKQVKCGMGSVVTRNIIEWTDSITNPKKRVEIKVSPRLKSVSAMPIKKQQAGSTTENASTVNSHPSTTTVTTEMSGVSLNTDPVENVDSERITLPVFEFPTNFATDNPMESTTTTVLTSPSSSSAVKNAESPVNEPIQSTDILELTSTIIPGLSSVELSSSTEKSNLTNDIADVLNKLNKYIGTTELISSTINEHVTPTEEQKESPEFTTVKAPVSTDLPIVEKLDESKKFLNNLLNSLKLPKLGTSSSTPAHETAGEIDNTTPIPKGSWKDLLHNILTGINALPTENSTNIIAEGVNTITKPLKEIIDDLLSGVVKEPLEEVPPETSKVGNSTDISVTPVSVKPLKDMVDDLFSKIPELSEILKRDEITKPFDVKLVPATPTKETVTDFFSAVEFEETTEATSSTSTVDVSTAAVNETGDKSVSQTPLQSPGENPTPLVNVQSVMPRSPNLSNPWLSLSTEPSVETSSLTSAISSTASEISLPTTVTLTTSSDSPAFTPESELSELLNDISPSTVENCTSQTPPSTLPNLGDSSTVLNIFTTEKTNESTAPLGKFRLTVKVLLEDINDKEKEKLLDVERHMLLHLIGKDHPNFPEQLRLLNETISTQLLQVLLDCARSISSTKGVDVTTESSFKNDDSPSGKSNSGKSNSENFEINAGLRAGARASKDDIGLNAMSDNSVAITEQAAKQAIVQSLPDIQEDVLEGLHHVTSKLTNERNGEPETEVKADDLENKTSNFSASSLFDFDVNWRRKREATEIGHWSNERIKETALGRKLRSFTQIDLHRIQS